MIHNMVYLVTATLKLGSVDPGFAQYLSRKGDRMQNLPTVVTFTIVRDEEAMIRLYQEEWQEFLRASRIENRMEGRDTLVEAITEGLTQGELAGFMADVIPFLQNKDIPIGGFRINKRDLPVEKGFKSISQNVRETVERCLPTHHIENAGSLMPIVHLSGRISAMDVLASYDPLLTQVQMT